MLAIQKHITSAETEFNNTITALVSFMSNIRPKSLFAENKETVENIIKKRPDEPVAYFVKYVYSDDDYRKKLLARDEDFFMNADYSNAPDINAQKLQWVFDFKKLWKGLDKEDRELIKDTMVQFVEISEKYIFGLIERRKLVKEQKEKDKKESSSSDKENIKSEKSGKKYTRVSREKKYSRDDISVGSSDSKNKKKKKSKKKKTRNHKSKDSSSSRDYDFDSISVGSFEKKKKKVSKSSKSKKTKKIHLDL